MAEDVAAQSRLVVGFDGSEGSQRALEWAAEEARRRAPDWRWSGPGRRASSGPMRRWPRWRRRVWRTSCPPRWAPGRRGRCGRNQTRQVATVLLEQAQGADMLVVGSRGQGGFAGLLLGSVGVQVATHDSAAVVLIVRR